MAETETIPRLRAVEAFPVRVDGQDLICLRDPSGLSESVLTVPRPTVEILALLDGTRTLLDVQADIMRRHAMLLPRDQLEALVATLDQHLFLESARLQAERTRLAAAFRTSTVRAALHAGKAYPDKPAALGAMLDGFFAHPEGPGAVDRRRAATLRGLIAPHIDFQRGGPRFGDTDPVSRAHLARIEAEDRALLSLVASGDPGGFFTAVARDGDSRRICGLSPIYALLETLPSGRGQLLRYGQWPDPHGTVTFASLAFEEECPAGGLPLEPSPRGSP